MNIKTFLVSNIAIFIVNFCYFNSVSAQSLPDKPKGTTYTIIMKCKAPAGKRYSSQSDATTQLDGLDNFYKVERRRIYNWDFKSQAWTYILGADYFISEAVFEISDRPGSSGLIRYKAEINRSNGLFSVERLRTSSDRSEYVSETWQGKCNRSKEPVRTSRVRPQ